LSEERDHKLEKEFRDSDTQGHVYYPLGSEKALEADFRLISTTNRDRLVAISYEAVNKIIKP
jgi:sigma54-dependent transcription regulator